MPRPTVPLLCLLALTLWLATPADAQWVAVGRWAQGDGFRFVAPGTWMVLAEGERVTISAEGDNHVGRLDLWCRADAPAGGLRFSGYYGEGLQRTHGPLPWPSGEAVVLMVDGRRFERVLRYDPLGRDWSAEAAIDPALLDALSNGSALELRGSDGGLVTRLGLSGSGAAREALRRVCRI